MSKLSTKALMIAVFAVFVVGTVWMFANFQIETTIIPQAVADEICQPPKVWVCQVPPGNPENQHSICVAEAAVPALIAQGSYLGICQGQTNQDICPNLDGDQLEVPEGYYLDDNTGECLLDESEEPLDVCQNIEGDQTEVPTGYHLEGNDCILNATETTDVCQNIEGDQTSIPDGYILNSAGDCVIDQGETGEIDPSEEANNEETNLDTTGIIAGAATAVTPTANDPADPAVVTETISTLALETDSETDPNSRVLGATTLAPTGQSTNYLILTMILAGCTLLGLSAWSLAKQQL
jgi:hypothetical protein